MQHPPPPLFELEIDIHMQSHIQLQCEETQPVGQGAESGGVGGGMAAWLHWEHNSQPKISNDTLALHHIDIP